MFKINQQLDIIEEVKKELNGYALDKLNSCLNKNPDLVQFTSYDNLDFRLKQLLHL
jgi:hypothetical protein